MSNNLVRSWIAAKERLASAMAEERELREALIDTYTTRPDAGTVNVDLTDGSRIKFAFGLDYKLADGPAVDAALREIAKLGPEQAFVANRLVKWEPKLVLTEYNKLPPDSLERHIINGVLTTKPKSVQVKFEES